MSPAVVILLGWGIMGLLPTSGLVAQATTQLRILAESTQVGEEVAAAGSPSGAPLPAASSLALLPLERSEAAPANRLPVDPQAPVLLSIEALRQVISECHLINGQMASQSSGPGGSDITARGKPVYLRQCYEWTKAACTWAPSTAREYRLTLERWEKHWSRRGEPHGPDIRDIKDGDFARYCEIRDWHGRTAELYWTYFEKLLKSATLRHSRLKYGRPAADVVLKELPTSGLEGCEQKVEVWDEELSEDALCVEQISQLMYAAQGCEWPVCPAGTPPGWTWAGMMWLEWYCGPRMKNGVLMDLRNFDWTKQTLKYRESKRKKIVIVPLPDVAMPLLRTLKAGAERAGRKHLFAFPPYCVTSPTSTLYKYMASFHERAKVEPLKKAESGRTEWFHQFRKSCTTQWIETASGLQRFVTGHKTGDVSDDHYAKVLRLIREAAPRYPVPEWLTAWNEKYAAPATGS